MFVRGLRSYSTTVPVYTRPTFRQLMKRPVFKTLVLTFMFGSAMAEVVHHKRRLADTTHRFNNKIEILEEIIQKLEKNEPIDIERELRLANALTQTKEVDIEIDDAVENFFKQLTEEVPALPALAADKAPVDATVSATTPTDAATPASASATIPTTKDTTNVKFL